MLKQENRIRKNKEFDQVFKTGQTFYSQTIGVKAALNNLAFSRFGILISTKVSKKAVTRNLFKRRLRAIIKDDLPLLKSGWDVVIIVFPLILNKKHLELKEVLENAFKKLNLYK